MAKINQLIAKIEYAVGSVMLISIVLLVFTSAVTRVFHRPLVWSVDASQLLFVWISMIGADLALKNKAHMGVDLLVRKFPQSLQKGLALFSYLLCCGFTCFVAYWGITLCIQNVLRKYATLKISYSFATVAVPILCFFMLLTLIEQIMNLLRNWKSVNLYD